LRASPADPLKKIRHAAGLWDLEMADLAQLLAVERSHLYRVIQGKRKSPGLRERIAGVFQAGINDIWPAQESGQTCRPGRESRAEQGAQAGFGEAGGFITTACTRPRPIQTQSVTELLRHG